MNISTNVTPGKKKWSHLGTIQTDISNITKMNEEILTSAAQQIAEKIYDLSFHSDLDKIKDMRIEIDIKVR